uniref:Uncharacterized protein n=1 Tax=Strigamia maritima TaxID=126957 RepID=T1JJB9_STRMM
MVAGKFNDYHETDTKHIYAGHRHAPISHCLAFSPRDSQQKPSMLYSTPPCQKNGTVASAGRHFLQGERGETLSFECSTTYTTVCELYLYHQLNGKVAILNRFGSQNERFEIRDSQSCIIDIKSVRLYDSAEFHCITDQEYEVFYVDVKVSGQLSQLFYDYQLAINESEHVSSESEKETLIATFGVPCKYYNQL